MVEQEKSLGLEGIRNANAFGTVSVMVGRAKAKSQVLAQIK